MANNKLVRSEVDKQVLGVAAGIGDYFSVDPGLVRAGFVLATIFGGGPIVPIAYVGLSVFMSPPNSPAGQQVGDLLNKAQGLAGKAADRISTSRSNPMDGAKVDYVDADEIDAIKKQVKVDQGNDDFLI